LTVQPSGRAFSQATTLSAWSPWISTTPSFTVPPLPQAALSCLAHAASAASSSGRPRTTVTPLPLRPAVSRLTRTMPSPAGRVLALQVHCASARPQPGQARPKSVE